MPFYDYKCGGCGRKFEVMHGMSGKPAGLKCEFCGSADVQRIFHAVGMMKKGADNFSALPAPRSTGASSCGSCSSHTCGSCH
jgi:putative FmdB family regulatory protein